MARWSPCRGPFAASSWQSVGHAGSGRKVVGLQHHPGGPDWRLAGDAAQPQTVERLRRWCGGRLPSLIIAPPGFRRATHNIAAAVRSLSATFSTVPIVLIGSTGVYADLHGRSGDESTPLTDRGRADGLLDIEAAVLAHSASSVVLQAGGLYGGQRHCGWRRCDANRYRSATGAATAAGVARRRSGGDRCRLCRRLWRGLRCRAL